MGGLAFSLLILLAVPSAITNERFEQVVSTPDRIAASPKKRGEPLKPSLTEKKAVSRINEKQAARLEQEKKNKGARQQPVVTFPSGESLPIAEVSPAEMKIHRDPTGSGNPLLVTSGKYLDKKLARNFEVWEFARRGRVTPPISRIDPMYVKCLQSIRTAVGQPVRIDSGYRSFQYNNEIYWRRGQKPTRSQHIAGRAGDIKISGMSGTEIGKVAMDACGPDISIGVGQEYAHIDTRGRFSIWKYQGVNNQQVAEVTNHRNEILEARQKKAQQLLAASKRSAMKRSKRAI